MTKMPEIAEFSASELECIPSCPYCGGHDSRDLFTERGFPYVQCVACELIYLRIRVREEFVHRIYDAPYHSSHNLRYARLQAKKRLGLVRGLLPGARVVEDGAGNGTFLAAAAEQGHSVVGCDLGLSSVKLAREVSGVELVHGRLDDIGLTPGSVDLIASFNLLSHLYAPWTYVRNVARLLAPGGRWICRTGNRAGVMAWVGRGHWSAPEHVFHFTQPLLERMVSEAGLRWSWVRPAFDSDFPYVFQHYAGSRPRIARVLHPLTSGIIRTWTLLGLPKEDVYFVAEQP